MMSSGNLPPNAYQSLSSRVMRIPMRHTFTLDQKRILMKYFEQGMVGQSLMYQEKIQQCAQEASLEFDVVRNWIGNQRRKRRLEEVQRACMQNYIDQVPPGECSEGMPPAAKMQSLPMAPPRQTQMLFLPHVAKQPGTTPPQQQQQQQPIHGGTPGEGAVHSSEASNPHQNEPHPAQINHMALTQLAPTNPNHQQQQPATHVQAPPHTSPRMPNRSVPPYHQPGQPVAGYPSVPASEGGPQSSMPAQGTMLVATPPVSQRSNHSSPVGSAPSPVMSAASMQDEEIGYHQTPIRGFYPGPRGPRMMMPGGGLPGHPQQRMSPPSFTVYPSVKMMPPPKESPEMRHHEIRRIVEQIQMNLDRLEQLGCESLLATVSTADRSAYVCGTPIALQYFSKVNKDHPMAEYIHKQVSSDGDFDGLDEEDDLGGEAVDDTGLEDQTGENAAAESGANLNKENHKHNETVMGIGQAVQGRTKMNPELANEEEDEIDMMGDGEAVIKAGEEIYIVNKERMVIGTGMLYPRPHEKMTFKSSPEYGE